MLKNQIVLDKIPDSFKQKRLGHGSTGVAYLTQDGKVFKEHYSSISYRPYMEYLTFKKSDLVAFPEKTIFLNSCSEDNFVGTFSPYIEGVTFSKIGDEIIFDNLMVSLSNLENELLLLAKEGIRFYDISPKNLIITPNEKLVIIDTDFFEIDEYDIGRTIKYSMIDFSWTILKEIIGTVEFESDYFRNLYDKCYCKGEYKPSKLLIEIKEHIEKLSKENIYTLNDFETNLPLILKK